MSLIHRSWKTLQLRPDYLLRMDLQRNLYVGTLHALWRLLRQVSFMRPFWCLPSRLNDCEYSGVILWDALLLCKGWEHFAMVESNA